MGYDGDGTGDRGRLVGGRYRLLERIGSGGMGTVWRALDELVEREVAVKQPHLPGDPEDESRQRAAHRLYREARAAARVDHPAAVSIHDVVVEEDGLPWIVMELVRGESLHELLGRGPVDVTEAARIGLAVLGALRAAHAVGIVHRDVKPANVLLGPHRRVVLTDFGIAHVQGEESLTAGGEFVGSLEFVAPERMAGSGAGPASDLWSLGVLLYAAVEGWSPFRRTTPQATLAAIVTADPPEPQQAGPLGPLIVGLLRKDPERRPAAEEVTKALEAASGQWPVPAAATAEAQETSRLREFAEDAGTVRLGASADQANERTPDPAPEPIPEPIPEPPSPPPKSTALRRGIPLVLLAALLAAAGWLGLSYFGDSDSGAATGDSAQTPVGGSWTAHAEKRLGVVLSLPSRFRLFGRELTGGDGLPRSATYTSLGIDVRIARWEEVPDTLMTQAEENQAALRSHYPDARTQYTNTSFHGHAAVLADTTYGLKTTPKRDMQLIVGTDSGRMYELRVTMPKGTPDEKKGTALFKGARDRLEILDG